MQACFIVNNENIELVLTDGSRKPLNRQDLRNLIDTFNNPKHYKSSFPEVNVLSEYQKIAIAQIEDNGQLSVFTPRFFDFIYGTKVEYISPREYGEKYGVSGGYIQRMCRTGKMVGAIQMGSHWKIPADAPYPGNATKRHK